MQKMKSLPHSRLCAAVLFLAATFASAQTAVTPNAAIPAQSVTPSVPDMQRATQSVAPDSMVDKRTLKIGGGDLLEVKVYGVPELTDSVRVSARGDVSLPLVGSVHLEGLTGEQGEKLI